MAGPYSPRCFRITVPATSANIGPGFDVLGVSFSLYLTLDGEVLPHDTDAPALSMTYEGEGAGNVPLTADENLITKTALYVLFSNHIHTLPPMKIHINNPIPLGRGLGSSGAAVVAGVLLANAACDLKLSKDRMLDYCLMIERHPDNVTPALMGGFIASYLRELEVSDLEPRCIPQSEPTRDGYPSREDPPTPPIGIGHYIKLGWAKEVKAVVVIPDFELPTDKARAVLPETYTRKDVIFNLQRVAVLTSALARSPPDANLIAQAMLDKIHQPYRKDLIPGMPEMLKTITPVKYPGLVGICLSGAGPTILALAIDNFDAIAKAIQTVFEKQANGGIKSKVKILEIVGDGAQIVYI